MATEKKTCKTFFRNILKRKKKDLSTAVTHIDKYDDKVYAKLENFIEDEYKKKTGRDVDVGKYIKVVDDNVSITMKKKVDNL